MSRSDGWSVAFTLLGAGTAYFIGGKYSAWGSIGVAAIIMLYLLFTKKAKSPSVRALVLGRMPEHDCWRGNEHDYSHVPSRSHRPSADRSRSESEPPNAHESDPTFAGY